MAVDIIMPNLGFDTQSGRLIEWLKAPGDTVKRGDIIAIVESDKANVELESVAAGMLVELLFPADTEVPVGAVIARVGALEEIRSAVPASSAPASMSVALEPAPVTVSRIGITEISPVARRLAEEHRIDLSAISGSGTGGKIMRGDIEALIQTVKRNGTNGTLLALPKVRKAAREAGIDLSDVPASGAKGQITWADLEQYQATRSLPTAAALSVGMVNPVEAEPVSAVETPVERIEAITEIPIVREGVREIPLTRARKVIGERLGRSKREAPHFYVSGEFDIESAMKQLPAQTRINDLIQYLTVQALMKVPELNATYEGDRLYLFDHIHLGIAVALEDGLITPVLRHAERYSLPGLAGEARALIGRAREKRLKTDDLQGGTFTLSNLGVIKQVERFTAVINPPQVAILAVGTVKQRPVVIDGGLHIHHTVYLTLSGDHRAVDGMHLARFMAAFQEALDKFVK